jgi:hypothetical protein
MRLRAELLSQAETHEREEWALGIGFFILIALIAPPLWEFVSRISLWVDGAVIVAFVYVFVYCLFVGSKDGVNHNT